MGMDYIRFQVDRVDPELIELVRQQAVARQSCVDWYSHASIDPVTRKLLEAVNRPIYLSASQAIEERIQITPDEVGAAERSPVWRVSAIAANSAFPPLWRVQSQRTILPDELPGQLRQWKEWVLQLRRGEQVDSVCWLHLIHLLEVLRYQIGRMKSAALDLTTRQAAWAQKPEMVRVRDEILKLREPREVEVPITPTSVEGPPDHEVYADVLALVDDANRLNREWDYHAKHRFGDHRAHYFRQAEDLRSCVSPESMDPFLDWLEGCVEAREGLYFDY